MKNFVYSIPTEIYFGKGQIDNLPSVVKKFGGSKVLLVYGGGSIKKIGIYGKIVEMFRESSIDFVELSGVEPNPRVTTVDKGAALCREHKVDIVLAVGGGSTIDCAKVIAAAASYEGNSWDIVLDPRKIKSVIPIISILTLSATGSEMDTVAVISNMETNDKLATAHPAMRPVASIMDPEYTFSVSKYQTSSGTADIISHVLESYFSNVPEGYLQSRFCEALLLTCIKYGPIAMDDPENYEARSNLMWASSWGINGLLSGGNPVTWTVHPIEHELSAYYDITHGVGLAILTPHWMRKVLSDATIPKFAEYGINVWKIDPTLPPKEIAEASIEKTAAFFKSMGLPSTLTEVGIDGSKLEIMAEKASKHLKGAYVELPKEDVLDILKAAL